MSKRLQVMVEEDELAAIQQLAAQQRISVAEWVRRALRLARTAQPTQGSQKKLQAIRSAIQYEFPTADIDLMLGEIESGYSPE